MDKKEEYENKIKEIIDETTQKEIIPLINNFKTVEEIKEETLFETIMKAYKIGFHMGLSCGRYVAYSQENETK